jgi:hypothetical protein
MPVHLHRFVTLGHNEFLPKSHEYTLDGTHVMVPDNENGFLRATLSFFEYETTEPHYFPSSEAENSRTCFTKSFEITEPGMVIISEYLRLVNDHNHVKLKYWVGNKGVHKRVNKQQKEVCYKHWSLIPRISIPLRLFQDEVVQFMKQFSVCTIVACAEYYLYPCIDNQPHENKILFRIFESNEEMPMMISWRFASALCFLQCHKLTETLADPFHRQSVFLYIQCLIRWKHFTLNQDLVPIIERCERDYGFDLDNDTIPRRYIVLKRNPIQQLMPFRLIFHYDIEKDDELDHELDHVRSITGTQSIHLEQVLSGSFKYVYSFAEEPTALSRRFEIIQQNPSLISIGYCNPSQSLFVRPEVLMDEYRQMYNIPSECQVDVFKAFLDKCRRFIDNAIWLENKTLCIEMMEDLICDIPTDSTSISTLYMYVFDEGSCQIGII